VRFGVEEYNQFTNSSSNGEGRTEEEVLETPTTESVK
jgi:hypothetical protein